MKSETKKAFLRLKELASAACENLFERIKLAAQVLADDQWIVEVHHGDQDIAAELIETEYFADICKLIPLAKIVAIYRMFPKQEQWAEVRYNLRAMEGLYDQERRREEQPARTAKRATVAELTEAKEKVVELEYSLKRERSELDKLREENERLREENARLKGEVLAYERMLAAEAASVSSRL